MADPYAYDNSRQALYTPAVGATFFKGWDQPKDTTDHDLLCAEMSRLAYADKQKATEALRTVGFTLKLWVGGETPAARKKTLGTDGFIATSEADGLTVFAFRGTESTKPEDLLADGFADSGPWVKSGQVHQGFAHAYGAVREVANEVLTRHPGTLLITGHSLGAALATLAAAEHATRQPELITFGSPRVGDRTFAASLNGLSIHRFVDCCDLVTRIPPKEFGQTEIEELLADLVVDPIAKGGVPAVASALSLALGILGIRPKYVDVGDAKYRDRAGNELQAGTTIADDQKAARTAYQGHVIPRPKDVLETLLSGAAAAGAKGLREALRRFGAALFQGGTVPLRDLADHAPINYVSIFTGRV